MSRALWFEGPGEVALRDEAPPVTPPGGVVARALASGISQGTELLLVRGEAPARFDPSLDAPGARVYPRRYGYAWVGEVTAGALPPGTRVFALAPHGEAHALAAGAARVLPAEIPAARATLAANLETAVTAAWDGEIGLGDRVVVLGAGVVGALAAWLARRAGASRVEVIDPSPSRRAVASALGADAALAPGDDARRPDADVVIEATGRPEALAHAIARAAPEARVVVASFYGARVAPVPLGDAFHRRRLALVASQVSRVPPGRAPRWDHARRFALVVELLRDERLDLLLAPGDPFDDAPRVYAELAAGPPPGPPQRWFRYEPRR